jgi:hypothetical protein
MSREKPAKPVQSALFANKMPQNINSEKSAASWGRPWWNDPIQNAPPAGAKLATSV